MIRDCTSAALERIVAAALRDAAPRVYLASDREPVEADAYAVVAAEPYVADAYDEAGWPATATVAVYVRFVAPSDAECLAFMERARGQLFGITPARANAAAARLEAPLSLLRVYWAESGEHAIEALEEGLYQAEMQLTFTVHPVLIEEN